MKECKLIRINDGKPQELTNGNFLHAEEYVKTSKILNEYLSDGWEVRSMVPVITPGSNEEGCFPFYMGGYTFYLERTVNQ